MRIPVGTGEDLKKFFLDQGVTLNTKELAQRIFRFTKENITELNIKRRLDRWFKEDPLNVEANKFRELFIAAGVTLSSYHFSAKVRRDLKLDVNHGITGKWFVYRYSDAKIEDYKNFEDDIVFMLCDVMEVWEEDDGGFYCTLYQPDVPPEIHPRSYYHGKVKKCGMFVNFEITTNDRKDEWVYLKSKNPDYGTNMEGLELAYSCEFLERTRIWFAEREKISDSDAKIKLEKVIKKFKYLEKFGILGYTK